MFDIRPWQTSRRLRRMQNMGWNNEYNDADDVDPLEPQKPVPAIHYPGSFVFKHPLSFIKLPAS